MLSKMSFASNKERRFVLLVYLKLCLARSCFSFLFMVCSGSFCILQAMALQNALTFKFTILLQNWASIITNWSNFDVIKNRVTVVTNWGSIFVLKSRVNGIIKQGGYYEVGQLLLHSSVGIKRRRNFITKLEIISTDCLASL